MTSISSRILAGREAAMAIHGAKYQERVAPWKHIALKLAARFRCEVADLPLELECRKPLEGMDALMMAAAVVEILKERKS